MAKSANCVITKLFDIYHGNKFDLNKMTVLSSVGEGVSFVGRSASKNGVVAEVAVLSNVAPYSAGAITVALGGSALSSFVQPRPFYTAQNIDVLVPKFDMTLDMKLYYCLCIEANRFRYSTFGREANRTLRYLQLPDKMSTPEWVAGATNRAVKELSRDLLKVVGSEYDNLS